jgi:hypothetical protein
MNLEVSGSYLEPESRGFPAAFGAESEFRDVDGCCSYGVFGEGARIPIGDQMQFVELMINVNPKTFENQIQPWPKSGPSLTTAATLYWLH